MFRQAAFNARRRREGELLIVQSPHAWMFTLLAVFALLITFVVLFQGQFGRSQLVRGILVPSKGLIKIYPELPLTVVEVLCEEGDRVSKGAPLLRLATHRAASGVTDANTAQLELIDQRLSVEQQKKEASRHTFAAREQQLRRRIEGAQSQLDEVRIQTAQQTLMSESAVQQFSKLESLLKKSMISNQEYEERRRAKLSNETSLQAYRRALVQLGAEVKTLQAELATMRAQFQTDQLRARGEVLSLESQRVVISEQSGARIVAPREGVIQGIHIDPGQRAMPQRPVVTLFPADAVLEAELYVPGSALGAVYVEQQIQLNYDAFPFDKFGGYRATVSHVSYALVSPDELGSPLPLREPVYRVTATLQDFTVGSGPQAFALKPGMSFSSSIISEPKKLADWLLQPLRRVTDVYWGAALQ